MNFVSRCCDTCETTDVVFQLLLHVGARNESGSPKSEIIHV